jgi:hypothetical protein
MTEDSREQRAVERWQHRRALLWVVGGGLPFIVTFVAAFVTFGHFLAGWW